MKTLRAWTLALLAAGLCTLAAAQALRPEVAKPLQQAGELLKAGKSKEALAKVREADAVPNKTAQEQLTIERMRGAAAQRAGDNATVVQAFEAVYASGKLSGARAGAGGRIAGLRLFAAQGQRQGPAVDRQGPAGRRQQRAAEAVAGLPARAVGRLRAPSRATPPRR